MIKTVHLGTFFFSIILFLFMWILFGWNTYTLDYDNYSVKFYDSDVYIQMGFVDIGYSYLNNFFYRLGYSFEEFRIIFSFFCLTLLYKIIFKQTLAPILVLIIYIFSIYCVDLVQMRNILAYLLCFSFLHLILYENKRYRLFFAFIVLVCSTIHIGMLFYLIFSVVNIEKYYKIFPHLFISLLMCLIFPGLSHSLVILSGVIVNDYLFSYSLNSLSISMLVLIFDVFVIKYFVRRGCGLNVYYPKYNLTSKYGIFIYNCNVLFLYLMPLVLMNMTFIRLLRNFYLINIIYIVNKLVVLKQERNIADYLLFVFYVVDAFYFFVWIKGVISPLLQNNSFL